MTKNQKIAIGIGALALGYWLYTKNKASKSAETPATQPNPATPSVPQNTGDTPCPQGKVSIQMNCIKAPCPSMCVDKPANATTHQKPYMPQVTSAKYYTCKDGSVERRLDSDYTKFGKMAPPCYNKGGIVNERRF